MSSRHVKGVCTRADPFTAGNISADFADTETHMTVTLLMSEGFAATLGVAVGKEVDVTLEVTHLLRNASAFKVTEPQPAASTGSTPAP